MDNIIFLNKTGIEDEEFFRNRYQVKKFPAHNTLYMQGEKSFYMYYILKGRIKVFMTNEFGKEYITHIYESQMFFGHDTLLSGGTHHDYAMTLEDSEIVKFTKEDLFLLLDENKEACMKFLQNLSCSLKESEKRLIALAYNSARKKIADALLFYYGKNCPSSPDQKSFRISRNDLSALSGIAPESVSRTLTDFKLEGLIQSENGNIKILNVDKLQNIKN